MEICKTLRGSRSQTYSMWATFSTFTAVKASSAELQLPPNQQGLPHLPTLSSALNGEQMKVTFRGWISALPPPLQLVPLFESGVELLSVAHLLSAQIQTCTPHTASCHLKMHQIHRDTLIRRSLEDQQHLSQKPTAD